MMHLHDQYIEQYPNDANLWYNKGLVLEAIGRTVEARCCLHQSQRART